MDDEPKRRSLTPLSSELTIRAEPAPKPPSALRRLRERKRNKPVPTTKMGVVVAGVERFLFTIAALTALISVAAVLLIWLADVEPKRAFMAMFLAGGCLLVGGGAMSAADMGGSDYYWDQQEKEQRVSYSFVFIVVGLPLIAVGLLLEAL